jgi:tol-pal system protein YbgF
MQDEDRFMKLMKLTQSKRNVCMAGIGMAALLSTACVLPDQLSTIQKDMADLQQEMSQIRSSQAATQESIARLENDRQQPLDAVTREEFADSIVELDTVARRSDITAERIRELSQLYERLTQDLEQTRQLATDASQNRFTDPDRLASRGSDVPGITSEDIPPIVATLSDPDELYNTAYTDFSKGNYALAISGFNDYFEQYPDRTLSGTALYWIGECHFSQGNFPEAIQSYDRMLELFSESNKAAAANLKKALAYLEQSQVGRAIVQLRFVVSTYPGSDEARIAKDKLTSLGA